MACKIALFSTALFLLIALTLSAPADPNPVESVQAQKEDLEAGEKDDLKTAASHWGGYGGHWGGWGHYGHYPHYSYWGWPSYGYGYGYGWPYGVYGHGHHGYWWK